MLNIVKMSHRVARNQKQIGAHDQEAIRIMRRGGNGCFDWKTEEEAQLNRREGKQACHMDHVKRLILSAKVELRIRLPNHRFGEVERLSF